LLQVLRSESDPHVWTGGALQEKSVSLECSGLAPMYPAFGWSSSAPGHHGYKRAFDLINRQASRAMWVTSSRMRREDRCSISSILSRRPRWGMGVTLPSSSLSSVQFLCSIWRPFLRPDLRVFDGVVSRCCQGWPGSGPPEGLGLDSIEHDGTLALSGPPHADWDVASDIFLTSKLRP